MGDNWAKPAVVFGVKLMIGFLKVAEITIDDFEKMAFVK
jgi:hypothetical protein